MILLVGGSVLGCADAGDAEQVPAAAEAGETDDLPAVQPRIRGTLPPVEMSDATISPASLPPISGEERAQLTYAPEVPPLITRRNATRVIVHLETEEVVKELADGVFYRFWTFGGETPGPMIRVREGDLIEFHLSNNPSNSVAHNIDLHAVTGTGGGAAATIVAPGQTAVFEARAIKPGLYIYHCAMAPVAIHIANGMYGLILVQPKDGMPPVDREFYVLQSEFYTEGKFMEKGLQDFSMEKALAETPDYVVFNGGVGTLTDDNSLTAAVGEKVRFYLGNAGPNLISSFHLIGEMFDDVYMEGGTVATQHNVQTTLIPAGGSSIVDFTLDVPGHYTLVDHSIFRAFNKGALGSLVAIGPDNPAIFTGQLGLEDYVPAAVDTNVVR